MKMDKLGVCTSRHVRTVSLVVTAIDDFTGRVITGSNARVWIDGAKPPIKKSDGLNVFVDLPSGEHTVHAEGGFYAKSSCVCRVSKDTLLTLKIRLTPGKNAPLSSDTATVEGKAPAGTRVYIRPCDRALSYKLLTDGKRGDRRVGIYHLDGVDIEGKLFCICGKDNEEYVRVYRAESDGKAEYLLDGELCHDYPKIGTLVYPVSESCANEKGEFFVPVGNLSEKSVEFVCRTDEKDSTERAFHLSSGSRVKLD